MIFDLICPHDCAALQLSDACARCPRCGRAYACSNGIWRLHNPIEAQRAFLEQYKAVREAEGWGAPSADYYLNLPWVSPTDPQYARWRVHATSFKRLLSLLGREQRILDVGAGNGWLSYQLTRRGHMVAALDLNDDDRDGLGAHKFYPLHYDCFQADFDRMPFADSQFDAVIFNASLHYAREPLETLREVAHLLKREGKVFVIDSPIYNQPESGERMMDEKAKEFRTRHGFEMTRDSTGFLTFDNFAPQKGNWIWYESRPTLRWGLRPWRARLRGQREPAHFGVMAGRPHA